MKIIAIEEHWNSVNIRDALDRLPGGARDESVAFNTMGDNQARLEDIGQGRVEAMDAAGTDVSILSVVTPATQALPPGRPSRWPGSERRGHCRRPRASGPLPRVRDPADQRSAGRGRGTRTVRHAAGPRRRDGPRTDGYPHTG